jgi:hypothetical protein
MLENRFLRNAYSRPSMRSGLNMMSNLGEERAESASLFWPVIVDNCSIKFPDPAQTDQPISIAGWTYISREKSFSDAAFLAYLCRCQIGHWNLRGQSRTRHISRCQHGAIPLNLRIQQNYCQRQLGVTPNRLQTLSLGSMQSARHWIMLLNSV